MLIAGYWISWTIDRLLARARHERGQDLIEYSMLGGLIAGAIVVLTYLVLTGAIESLFGGIGNCVDWQEATGCLP